MLFSSLLFVFIFLPLVLCLYFITPWRFKNALLLFASLIFYAWGEPVYIVILLITIVADYSFGRWLSIERLSQRSRQWLVFSSVFVNLALLSYFKYADFVISQINGWLGTAIPLTDLPLPIGISFYTFQSMSYIIDIYRRKVKAERNLIDFATYVALFPQLVAGPIIQYHSIAEQLRQRTVSMPLFAEGIRRFIIGLAKKVLLANNIGMLWHTISHSELETMPVSMAWLGIIAFAFQIYYDFSGYSDMAIGLGRMFGFRFKENFNKPYTADSITDFWRRWHISLGSWFREYVYIPLGGNRRGLGKQISNIIVVWALTGFWHGASWNFMLWGLYFGIILMIEKWFLLHRLTAMPRWVRHLYALLLIMFGWVLFAFEELTDIGRFILAMLGLNKQPLIDSFTGYLLYTNVTLLIILVIVSLPRKREKPARILSSQDNASSNYNASILNSIWFMVLFVLCIAYLVDASFNPFLYFRF